MNRPRLRRFCQRIRDVRIAWLNVNNALDQLRTTEQLLQHATEAYDLADARYKTGISSIVELSQAQLNLTSAQMANTDARYNVLIQESNLARCTDKNHFHPSHTTGRTRQAARQSVVCKFASFSRLASRSCNTSSSTGFVTKS